MSHTYVFSPRFDEDGVYVDTFLDVTPCIGMTEEMVRIRDAAAQRLGAPIPMDRNHPTTLAKYVAHMQMRARLNSTDLHKVTTEEPITFDDLDRVLKDYQTRNLLRNFLKESRL
jgi:hypothetical protein